VSEVTIYTDLAGALERAKERSGATAADNAFLTELLQMSAGKDVSNVTHFRPFIVAARYLEQSQSIQALSSASGVQFTNMVRPIASLLALQAAYDASQGLIVPDGFAASSRSGGLQFSSRAYPTQVRT